MDVNSFDPYGLYQEYSPAGANYGNPFFNQLVHGLVGFNYTPRPESGQSIYESFIARQRASHFLNLQRTAFMRNPLMSALGMDQSPAIGALSRFAGSPDGMFANAMSPLIGGNPMAASMQLYAGLSGASTMGVFGRTTGVSEAETNAVMEALSKNFYNVQNYDNPEQRGVRSTVNARAQQHIIEQAESGLAGREYAEQIGIRDLAYNDDGTLTEESRDRIRKIDISRAGRSETAEGINIRSLEINTEADIKAELDNEIKRLLDENNEDAKKQLNDNLEELVRKYGAATKEELDKIRNDQGLIDTTKLKTLVDNRMVTDVLNKPADAREEILARTQKHLIDQAENGETGRKYLRDLGINLDDNQDFNEDGTLTEAGRRKIEKIDVTKDSDEPGVLDRRTLINRTANKKLRRKELDKLVEELDEARDDNAEDAPTREKDAEEKLKKQLGETGALTQDEIKKITGRDGKIDTEKAREYLNRGVSTDYLERAAAEAKKIEEVGYRFKGFNFEQSRGFKVEDFSSAFYKAADTRLIRATDGVAIADRMTEFSKNAGGALDAARSIFGKDKSGGDLVAKINEILGSATKDLSSAEGSAEIEKILRDAKATARVAGLSIETMLGIISSTKELAKNNPQLQFMSGNASLQIGMKAVQTAAALGSVMSSEDYRKSGGAQAMAAGQITATQEFMQSGPGRSVSALLAATSKSNPEVHKRIIQMIQQNDNSISGDFLQTKLIPEVMRMTGMRAADVNLITSNSYLAAQGMKDEETSKLLNETAEKSVADSFWQGMKRVGVSKEEALNEVRRMQAAGQDVTWDDVRNNMLLPKAGVQGTEVIARYDSFLQSDFMLELAPAKVREKIKEQIATSSKLDTEMSKEMASLNAPVVTQLLDALVSGENIGDSAQAIASVFATSNGKTAEMNRLMEAAQQSGIDMTEAIKEGGGNVTMAKKLQPHYEAFVDVRRAEMQESIDDKKKQKTKFESEGRSAEAEKLGEEITKDEEKISRVRSLTDQEMVDMVDVASSGAIGNNAAAARDMLVDLKKQQAEGKELSVEDAKRLDVLQNMESQGFLDSPDAFDLVATGKVKNLVPAAIKARVDQKTKQVADKKITQEEQSLEELLKTQATDGEFGDDAQVQGLLDYYKDRGGMQQAIADFKAGGNKGYFTEENRKEFAKLGGAGGLFNKAMQRIDQINEESDGPNKTPEDKSREDMKKLFEGLTKLLTDGNSISKALDGLKQAILTN